MDARQFAFLARQPSATLQARDTFWGLSKRGLAFILANMMFWQPVVAMADGIVVNGSGTSLGQAGNGVPIVNIAAPNGGGLSHNQFSDYNVGQQGVILNNAINRTQETQLGGIILGNPNLGGRAANVILNEVNGGSPSQLKGYTEVAGQSAHVIVANPYGVSCNGCGFINTPKATLTTGKPVIENGQLQRYQVDQGSVAIEGAGLNASNIDQFEIITRSAKINAEIQAKHLAVIAGANDVDAKTLNATARAANPADAPQLAIDSSALGGMYAGAIKLVGTEAGVGVKLDGKLIASGGDIQLDANGQLRMAEATAEKGAVAIKAQSLDAKGAVYAGTDLKVQTQDDLNNHSTLAAANSINLGSGGQLNNHGIIEAGVNADNSRNVNGDVTLTAQNLNNTGKSVVASRDLTVTTTQTLDNQGGTLSGQRQVTVSAGTLDNSHQGKLLSAERLQLNADQVRNGQGGLIKSQQSLNATLGHLGNSGGELSSQGSSTLVLAGMDNLTGVVLAQQTLEITGTAELDNQDGLLSGWQGLTLKGIGLNNSNKGTVSSLKGAVDITLSNALNNSQGGGLVSQQALDVKAASLDNSLKGMISSAGAQNLKLSERLDNSQGGSIDSATTLTLQAMALGNQGGTVNASGDLKFIGGDLDNSHGTFTGKQGVTLDLLGHLINNQGTLSAAGPLLLKRSTKVENQGGELSSQQWLRLFTEHLDNRQKGRVAANDSVLISASGEVQNSDGGEILSREADLQLNAERLDNAKGLLQAKTNLGLDVAAAAGNQGGQVIAQQGDLTLKVGHLDNRAGKVSALNGGATLETAADGRLDNRDGALFAQQALHISAKDLDNSAGQISARQIELELAGALDNRQGLIESRSTLATAAASLDNQRGQLRALGLASKTRFDIGGTFDNRDGLLETANHDLAFDAGGFNNRGGSLLHSGSGVFGISMANLEDVGGRLKTAGQLTLEAERWTNSSAIQADQLLVKVDQLTQTADGQLLAGNGLTGSGSHWSNDGLIGSDAALNLDLNGNYSGKGRLSSLGQLDLHAAQLDLADSASIAGGANSTLKVDGALNSAGRITASQKLQLNAASIHNLGTLGSGEDLNLTAATLVNDHGLISSGGNMQLLTTSFTNRYAQVYSLGTALIAKDDQQTRADLLDNRSGDIESLGKLSIAASTVNNVMDVLEYTEHEKSAASITRLSCTLIPGAGCDDRGGGRINGLWEVAETDRLRVTNSSAAASLNSGADLQIDTQTLTNTSSLITAAGDLNIQAETVHNQGLQPQEITTLRRYWSFVNETGNAAAHAAAFNARNNPTPSASFASDLSGFIGWTGVMLGSSSKVVDGDQSFAATLQAGGKVNLKADKTLDNSVIRSFYEYVGAGKTLTDTGVGNGYSTPIRINPQLPPELAQQQVNPLVLPGFTLPTSGNGLFRLSGQGSTLAQAPTPAQIAGLPDAASLSRPHKYLIETNPALTNLKQFMSSDYLLSHLGYNPDESAKRLGDGFYEQKLIQQAMVARTGQRFIDGQDSNEKLFKHLMDNALQSKQQLDLSVGVTLTSEQVAALTHDIVWLESHEVNGEQVLVPVLYLAQANNRLAPNGSLIAGKDVSLIAGKDLNNVGTLRAANDLSAVAGENLVNSGLAEAGKGLSLTAGKDLLNKAGGVIAGRDVALTATDGDVVNERTLTSHQSNKDSFAQQRDFVDSAARVEAANNLTINAGRDFNNSAGVLKSAADTRITAGRDVSLTAVEQVVGNQLNANYRDKSVTQHGSTLEAGRDLSINAGRDITAIASQIEAKRDVSMSAKENLTLASAANEQHWFSQTKSFKGQEDHGQQVSTAVTAGGSVVLSAGKDLELIASRVSAGDEAYLVAGGKLALESAEDTDYSFYSKTKKSSSGKKSRLDETSSTTNVASLVTSGGNSALVAGQDLLIKGSGVTADKGGVRLVAGNDVQIEAVTDSQSARHESSSSKKSWGGLKSSKIKDQVSETRTEAVGSTVSGDTISVAAARDVSVTGSSLVSTSNMKVQAGRDLTVDAAENTFQRSEMHKAKTRDLSGIMTANNLGVDDITGNQHLSIGSQKHNGKAQETTLTGSTIGSSEGSVQLIAGRELKVVASDLVSTKDMTLSGSDVMITAGVETARQSTTDKSNSLAVGRVVGGMVIDTAQSIRDNLKAAKNADDDRLKAVKTAQAVLSAYNMYVMGQESNDNRKDNKPTNSSGSLIKIGTELGSIHSKSTSDYSSETAKQSSLLSGAGLAVIATGKVAGSSGDIHVVGSSLKAEDTLLSAKNNITLESAQNRKEWDNQNHNSKTAIGASFNIGAQNGFTLDLGAQVAKGMGKGSELNQVNSTVDTGRLAIKSGQDTTLAGAQVRADHVDADIGGSLNISSRQDEASQVNRQTSGGFGGSICIPPICYGAPVTGSANIAASKMDSAYKAVIEQTGLFAGNGGYNINVGTTTVLHGGVIASNATADKNHLSTDRLIVSDIKNSSEIKSQAAGVSVSYTGGWGGDGKPGIGGSIPLMLKDSDHSSTRSAISEGTITVRNPEGGNDLLGLNRDTANANQKLDRPDERAMQERMDLIQGVVDLAKGTLDAIVSAKQKDAIKQDKEAKTSEQKQAASMAMAEANRWAPGGDKRIMADVATGLIAAGLGGAGGTTGVGILANTTAADTYKKIGDYANRHYIDAKDDATRAAWAEGGAARVLLHTLAGAVQGLAGGNVQGSAMGAATSAALMPAISKALENNGVINDGPNAWAALIATGLSGAAGSGGDLFAGIAGGRAGAGVEVYNRQLHPDEVKFLQDKDRIARFVKYLKETTGEDISPELAAKALSKGGAALADAHWTDINGSDLITQTFIRGEAAQSGLTYQDVDGRKHLFFVTTAEEYRNETINLKALFDAYAGKGSSVERFLSDNFVEQGQNTWRDRYRAGQELGLADASKRYEGTGGVLSGVAGDVGAIIAGMVHFPVTVVQAAGSDEIGPVDSAHMMDYYQRLLHIQSRATEAGYIAESDYATSQRLMLLGLPVSELGGLALLKAFQKGSTGTAIQLAISAEKKAVGPDLPSWYREDGGSAGAMFTKEGGLPDGYRRVLNTRTGNFEALSPDGTFYVFNEGLLTPKIGGNLAALKEAEGRVKAANDAAGIKAPIDPKQLALVTSHKNAHAISVHGGSVTDGELIYRAKSAIKPDANVGPSVPPLSSAFHSDDLLVFADQAVRNNGALQKAIARDPGQSVVRVTVADVGDLGADLGRGFKRVYSSGNLVKNKDTFGAPERVGNLRSVEGVYMLNPKNNVWETISIFPAPKP
ncbi:two-partner secretion domain-containing protein [Pseudomonas sp. 910_21]|uniref:two-partner secretion domain-containing protein n=1 Tax=Pseudomonas sp. 910_21 TaxID=2604460 RepID=UPI00406330E3